MGVSINLYRIKIADKSDINDLRFIEYSDEYPDWTKQFISEYDDEPYDYESYFKSIGKQFSDYEFVGMNFMNKNSEVSPILILENIDTKEELQIDLNSVPTYTDRINILGLESKGYQTNSFNKKFYDDLEEGKIKDTLWTYKEVEEYMEKYCDDIDNRKEYFRKYILDRFMEGECCVIIS